MPSTESLSGTAQAASPQVSAPPVIAVEILPTDITAMIVLAGLALMMQVAINVMIPALPEIRADLQATPLWSGFTLTAFMVGYGSAPLVLGPLSDRFGRRPVLISGLVLYTAASVACALTPSIEHLVAARLVQGIGGGAGWVNSRAIARDLFSGPKFTRVNAYLSGSQGIGPMLAPLIGALLQEQFGWRSTFAFTAIFGTVLLLIYSALIAETNTKRLTRLDISALKRGYREVLGSRRLLHPAFTSAFSFASWYTFFAAGPAYFIEYFGTSPAEFGTILCVLLTAFVGTTILAGRKAASWGEARLVSIGRLLAFVGVTLTAVLAVAGPLSPYTVIGPLLIYSAGSGLLLPLLNAAALRSFPHIAGTAASVQGAIFQGTCASGTVAAGLSASHSPTAFFAVMVAAQCLSVAAYTLLRPVSAPSGDGPRVP